MTIVLCSKGMLPCLERCSSTLNCVASAADAEATADAALAALCAALAVLGAVACCVFFYEVIGCT